jgi:UDP-N-acetylmuramate--alanine ligase
MDVTDGPNVAKVASDLEVVEVDQLGAVHIIGLGGAGMSAIARILLDRGVAVSGSDAKDSKRLADLRACGAVTHVGHDAANLGDADTVMYSTAVPETNPELRAARARGLRVLERSAGLASVMRPALPVAVGGTHGKTTTTSMVAVALQHCGADPSYIVGSEMSNTGINGKWTGSQYIVVEADESDGSFLKLDPHVAVVTNLEADHLNYWGDLEALERGFDEFAASVQPRGGFSVVCLDDPGAAALAQRAVAAGCSVRTYGTSAEADYRLVVREPRADGYTVEITSRSGGGGIAELQVLGLHNALNATAAFAVADGLGFDAADILEGLAAFTGTRRRFDFKGEVAGVRVYDDYAHHPTEIAATLRAAQDFAGDGNVIVAFQAHHYYRTALFLTEFGEALGIADRAVVLEVFAPGETPIPGASGQGMAAAVPLPAGQVIFEPSWAMVPQRLVELAQPGDIIMTLGAGDISLLASQVLELLAARGTDVD